MKLTKSIFEEKLKQNKRRVKYISYLLYGFLGCFVGSAIAKMPVLIVGFLISSVIMALILAGLLELNSVLELVTTESTIIQEKETKESEDHGLI